jgi:hypothetical protein
MKYNKEQIIEQIDIDFRNFKTINKTYIDSVASLIKKIDIRILEINDVLFEMCQRKNLTYKVGIYFKNPKRFIIWFGFNKTTKKWKYSLRNFRSIMTTVRTNIMFHEIKNEVMEELRLADKLIKLRNKLSLENKINLLLKNNEKKFKEL